MPSFRSIFLVAATAFAALSSAAPVAGGVDQSAGVVDITNVANNVLENVKVHNIDITGVGKRHETSGGVGDLIGHLGGAGHKRETFGGLGNGVAADSLNLGDVSTPNLKSFTGRDGQATSLPAILLVVKAKLLVVSDKLNTLSVGKDVVEVALLVEVLGEVKTILSDALAAVKLIINNPLDVILTLDGKVLAIVDICSLLLVVLSLVCGILDCVLHLVATVSLTVVAPLIAGVSAVLVELLACILAHIPGLFVALHPLLGPVISVFVTLKLDAVVQVLHGKF
ncbi:hypothetical protein DXG01_005387 [Tephrocybe rancida]|nr:hypothetical protein DXG01_005387 [Tephrocybe rancida]